MINNLEIEATDNAGFKILKLKGRIDASQSPRLSEAVKEIIRSGSYDIVLDVTDVDYISSAGVRVLLTSHRELNSLNGSFALYKPNESVSSIINMMGLSDLLNCAKFEGDMNGPAKVSAAEGGSSINGAVNGIDINVLFKSDHQANVKISGNIDKISSFSYLKEDMRRMATSNKTIAFGLGAFGPDGRAAICRAGEFLAVCGFAAYMPSDGSKNPDYIIAGKDYTPEINYLYSAASECDQTAAFTFKSAQAGAPVKFSDIVKTAHSVTNCDNILVTVIGEVRGIVGASLASPPVASNDKNSGAGGPFEFPRIRENFNITSEPAYNGNIAVCAGVSCSESSPDPAVAKFLRPLAIGSILSGHFHAAVFDFTPLKKNCADPADVIAALYEKGAPEAVLHLINDWRGGNGAGETEFISGSCWIANIAKYETDDYPEKDAALKRDMKEVE